MIVMRIVLEVVILRFSPAFSALQIVKKILNKAQKRFNVTKSSDTPPGSRKILFVEVTAPRLSRDAGSERITAIAEIFKRLGFDVELCALDGTGGHASTRGVFGPGRTLRNTIKGFRAENASPDLIWISRMSAWRAAYPTLATLFPKAKFIFDTVDLHGLRLERMAERYKLHLVKKMAQSILRLEIDYMKRSDIAVVVSRFESDYLFKLFDLSTFIVPTIHDAKLKCFDWSNRRGQVFIGNFSHTPNIEGINWYLQHVWPKLPESIQSEGLKIIGSPKPRLKRVSNKVWIRVLGKVEDADSIIGESRVSIAPLLSGAGVKGKITQSLSMGTPVVATRIGAEGMSLTSGKDVIISDTAETFAKSVEECMVDEKLFSRLQEGGLDLLSRNYSKKTATSSISRLIEQLDGQ